MPPPRRCRVARGTVSYLGKGRLKFGWKEHCHTLLPPMNGGKASLGSCSERGEKVSEAWVLREYEKNDGTEGVWTECPTCGDVVAPE